MYDKIILALSLEHGIAEQALETARRLGGKDAEIIAVHVYEPPSGSVSTYLDEDLVRKAYDDAKRALKARFDNAPEVTPVILKGHSSRTITEYAAEINANAIIVGSHMPGLRDYFLGTTAARIVRHAPCAVIVLR
ncbi:universal stress protein [Sedimentitalea sp. CY04]|uniref:Universal stress protein n=2 Tax=Parasedimentitalea TaxID=2738399 RepID=A0A3T0N4J1_9RHOB|nr:MULTISPECIES: universal stress protein [Paracoccaceae]AZV78924.1 universal stress protein [Parasedimentitalea marina]NIZ63448.1 universal stress protein [Sedimentitalea sp. CY04]